MRNEATVAANSTFSKFDQAAETSEEDEQVESKKILNLPLPQHLNHLMRLFEQFEINFRLLRARHDEWTISFD